MAHARLRAVALAALVAVGCARAAPPAAAPPPPKGPVAFPDDPAPLPRYHSKRLALSVPLPLGREWIIDDHSRAELVMRHGPTRSTIVAAILRADALVGRNECEVLAREARLLPKEELRTLEDEVAITQETYDTRIRVAIHPGTRPDSPLVGYVLAVGGFLRKCFVFSFETEVDRADDEPVLSARLAFARARILGGVQLDAFASVPRDRAEGPGGPTGPPGAPPR